MPTPESSSLAVEKICRTCHTSKSIDEFKNILDKKDGKSNECKICAHKYSVAYYAAHRAERLVKKKDVCIEREKICNKCFMKKHREAFPDDKRSRDGKTGKCRECTKAYDIEWRLNHQEEEQVKGAEYRRIHHQEIRDQQKSRWAGMAPDKKREIKESRASHYLRNKEKISKQAAMQRKAHPEFAHTARRKRRARKKNAPINNLTHGQWIEIQSAQDHRCYYCGKRCKGKLTQDHITPLSRGGSHTLHNVIGACRECNSKKGISQAPIFVQPLLLTLAPAKPFKAS